MNHDCPHCRRSMSGKFVHWRKFAKMDHFRVCPLCNREIEYQMYPVEFAVRVLTILVVLGASYWVRQRGEGYLAALVTVTVVLGAAYFAVHLLLKDRPRFRKGRELGAA